MEKPIPKFIISTLLILFQGGGMGLIASSPDVNVDSLKQVLSSSYPDTSKLHAFHLLISRHVETELQQAEYYGRQALELVDDLPYPKWKARILYDMGLIFDHTGAYDDAIRNYQKALHLYQEQQDRSSMSRVLNNIGAIYFSRSEYEKAITYWKESIQIKNEEGMEKEAAKGLTNLGAALTRLKKYEAAKKAHQKALNFFEKEGDKLNMAKCYNNIGILLHKKEEKAENALPYYIKAKVIHEELQNEKGLISTHMNIGFSYTEEGKHSLAIDHFKKSFSLAEELGWKPAMKQIQGNLSETYALAGNHEKAYQHLRSYMNLKDSILNERSSKRIAELEAKFQNEKKEKVIKERTLDLERSRRNVLMLSAGLMMVVLVGLFFLLSHRQRKKAKEKLELAKSRFFSNIIHEFRTPMTLIRGPLEDLWNTTEDEEVKEKVAMSLRNHDQLMELTDQLLDVSRIESNKMGIEQYYGDVAILFKEIAGDFQKIAEQKGVALSYVVEKSTIETIFDADKFKKIFYNLFSNAVKFTPEGGKVEAELKESDSSPNQLHFKIRDTGIGMTVQQQQQVFDRFYQADGSSTRQHQGTEIGLSLVKELVDFLNGNIDVKSQKGEGTSFLISLPISNFEAYHKEGKVTLLHDKGTNRKGEGIQILIVEDHPELRKYLSSVLESCSYKVNTASNGKQGLRFAKENLPDVIVADIMMPELDGYEMCHQLKNESLTAHIPIIMLTAKTDQKSRMEGLEKGAEAYLSKPFSTSELVLRLNNLIEGRRKLQEHYVKQLQGKENKDEETYHDPFIQKAVETIIQHMENSQFSVEFLAEEMGLSRPQIYRKIKAVTGESATRLIRIVRLREAWKMLENHKGNVTEVAYAVGFNSQSYFSRCFTEEFGIVPKEVKKQEG